MTFLANSKMRKKLLLVLGFVLILTAAQTIFLYFNTGRIKDLSDAAGKAKDFQALLYEADARFRGEQANIRAFSLSSNTRYRKQYVDGKNDLNGVLEEMARLRNDSATFDSAYIGVKKLRDDWEQVVGDPELALTDAMLEKKATLGDITQLLERVSRVPASTQIGPVFKEQTGRVNAAIARIIQQTETARTTFGYITATSTVFITLTSFMLVWFFSSSISRPLVDLTVTANELAKGHVGHNITHVSSDEIGSLAQSFREVIEYNRTVASACEALGHGDLTIEVVPKSQNDIIATSFTAAVRSLRQTVSQLAESSTSLASSSDELSATSAQMTSSAEETAAQAGAVSRAAEQISSNVHTVVGASDQMAASISGISSSAQEAVKVAGAGVVMAADANSKMSKLSVSSQEIGEVVKVITSIAEQTHLLALNATIEAARAGAAGKGFAVVANEVKELARETAKATEDISRKIEAIQTDTAHAIRSIGEVAGIIAQINEIQGSIASAVDQQTATTSEIGRNIADVARGNLDIASNITGVASAARSTTEGATYTNQAAAELAALAATLQALVGEFDYGADSQHKQRMRSPGRSKVRRETQAVRPQCDSGLQRSERRFNGVEI